MHQGPQQGGQEQVPPRGQAELTMEPLRECLHREPQKEAAASGLALRAAVCARKSSAWICSSCLSRPTTAPRPAPPRPARGKGLPCGGPGPSHRRLAGRPAKLAEFWKGPGQQTASCPPSPLQWAHASRLELDPQVGRKKGRQEQEGSGLAG